MHETGGSSPTSDKAKGMLLRGLRKVVADRMVSSHLSIPPVTLTMKVDATETVKFRENLEIQIIVPFSYNAIFIKAIALALQTYPSLNSTLEGDRIKIHQEINVGLAISIEDGLIVPVIRNASKKSLFEVNKEVEDLVKRANEKKLSIGDVTGGTFTLTNLGMFGVDAFTPIILPSQVAILGVGQISDEPKVIGDRIEARKTMMLSLSFDHRVVDGALAAQFLGKIRKLLETPYELECQRDACAQQT